MPKYFPLPPRVVEVEVPVGDGDRDVTWTESFDIADQLAGTLGPVQTQDSADATDELDAGPLVLGDTADVADVFVVDEFRLQETADIADQLAGNLGPVQTQDSVDTRDVLDAGPLVLGDSADSDDAIIRTDLDAQAIDSADSDDAINEITLQADDSADAADDLGALPLQIVDEADALDAFGATTLQADDSISITDRVGQIVQWTDVSVDAADEIVIGPLSVRDETDSDDSVRVGPIALGDSADTSTTVSASLDAQAPDSAETDDTFTAGALQTMDDFSLSDSRQGAAVTGARLWTDTVVSNSGFTNPANATDLSEATSATISATQSGGPLGGKSATVNGNIQLSCPDFVFVPSPGTSGAQLQYGYTTTESGGLQNGNSVNVAIDYSVNDGGSWTNLVTVTNTAQTADPTLSLALNYTQLRQLRFRAVGSVVSGTTVLTGGANQTFSLRYTRVQFNAGQSL